MAVQVMPKVRSNYMGLSSDDKPSYSVNGSTFLAVDTGEQWIYFDGMWELDYRMIAAVKMALELAEV